MESVKKTEKSDKNETLEEAATGSDSPQMPKLNFIDLKQIMKEKQTSVCAGKIIFLNFMGLSLTPVRLLFTP